MSNNIRIRTTPNGTDKYLKVKLEQDFDFIEILSLKITQEDAYRKFCSDYGVIAGRVIINSGFGVPNAKVSVFIPLDEIDKTDTLISGLYPYEVITDKNSDGLRYNLLPRSTETNNNCFTPIGSFPQKREVLDNDEMLSVYCKYYKFTTTTNHAGDFMIFGVPIGTHIVHVDVDISDIGIASQRPYDFISQGTPRGLFYSSTKFKGGSNLDKLVQIKTLNAGVNVQPFWGDIENCEIGITRLDFDLNYNIIPSAIFMGSIFGDQDKHSVNKNCYPRKALGLVCDQVATQGTINMIRKTFDNKVESFDVEGGRVIDNNGTWAYQIPMNLDYMITNEFGDMVLSNDPNKGIPTRSTVRFKIGMDETGGEGRLRTRAKFLVPNNPKSIGEVDYSFDETTTNPSSYRDIFWNKIYSVSNFISRFQRRPTLFDPSTNTRRITGLKDVDACAGTKTPFPYNKLNTEINPIFFIICIIIKILTFIVFILNIFAIPIINDIILVLNIVIKGICAVINTIIDAINEVPFVSVDKPDICTKDHPIPYVPCIAVACGDANAKFAPGCNNGGIDGGNAWAEAGLTNQDFYYDNTSAIDAGLSDCLAFEMASALDIYQFDFYNDWINGTLYSYLLKYKKKKSGQGKFCEYECSGGGFTPVNGLDGDSDGHPDNECLPSFLADSCYKPGDSSQNNIKPTSIKEGLIKQVGDELYYASGTHFGNGAYYKISATELIHLGSVFDCDWQGIPKMANYLIPTTYKIPPDIKEKDLNGMTETTGQVQLGSDNTNQWLFFTVNCLGLHADYHGCLNIRHICEFGVNLDEVEKDYLGNIIQQTDGTIGKNDIDDYHGKYTRDVFTGLNSGTTTPWIGVYNLNLPVNGFLTYFNIGNNFTPSGYNFATTADNENDYVNFRGYKTDMFYEQPDHSYFFYFGLEAGKTSLDKMNSNFFTPCPVASEGGMAIEAFCSKPYNTGHTSTSGEITFTFINGVSPINWTLEYILGGGSFITRTGTVNSGVPVIQGNNMPDGTYKISGTGSTGYVASTTVIVPVNPPLTCSVGLTSNVSKIGVNDGIISITSVYGGEPPYTYGVVDGSGSTVVVAGTPITNIPTAIINLGVDTITGYTVTVTDSLGVQCITTGITIGGPTAMYVTVKTTNATCFGANDGKISVSVNGGTPSYFINITGPGYATSNPNPINLPVTGTSTTYTVKVVDSASPSANTFTNTYVLTQPPEVTISRASASLMAKQCDPTQYTIPFIVTGGVPISGNIDVQYALNTTGGNPSTFAWGAFTSMPYTTGVPLFINGILASQINTNSTGNIAIRVRYNGCLSQYIRIQRTEIDLPLALLTATLGSVPAQCDPLFANFDIHIAATGHGPYIVHVKEVSSGVITDFAAPVNTVSISEPITINLLIDTFQITVEDKNGCISPILNASIDVPTSKLGGFITTTNIIPFVSWKHQFTITGGTAPYNFINTFNFTDGQSFATPVIIIDAQGCIVIIQ